jgi:LAO/AO transport system kinase
MTAELNEALRTCVLEPILNRLAAGGDMEAMVEKMLKKEADPYSLAEGVARKYLRDV